MISDMDVCIHEAGHVLAHIRLAIDHDGSSVIPTETSAGDAPSAGAHHVWNEVKAADMVIAYLAGYGAMVAAERSNPEAGADDDFEQAECLLETWGLPGSLSEWKAKAVAFMRRSENVAAVRLIAANLNEHKRLDGDWCEVLVGVADGESSHDDLAQYLALRSVPGMPG